MIDYEEDWLAWLLLRYQGSVAPRALVYAIPATAVALFFVAYDHIDDGWRSNSGLTEITQSYVWNALNATLVFLSGFRAQQGFMRFWEGTGLLHQMRGEWFDTISNCFSFSIIAKMDPAKAPEVDKFRHVMVRMMSFCHGAALQDISGSTLFATIDTQGLDAATLRHIQDCTEKHGFNKVEVLLHMIQSAITWAYDQRILQVPAPILSRVYQTISRGFVNLLNIKKITDTKFPFPFVQLNTTLLFLHVFLTPLFMSATITRIWGLSSYLFVGITTFIPIFSLFSLNFIAVELENPFGNDDNDLPLAHFQWDMNNCLIMLLHPGTDTVASTSPRCEMDFLNLTLLHPGTDTVASTSPRCEMDFRNLTQDLHTLDEALAMAGTDCSAGASHMRRKIKRNTNSFFSKLSRTFSERSGHGTSFEAETALEHGLALGSSALRVPDDDRGDPVLPASWAGPRGFNDAADARKADEFRGSFDAVVPELAGTEVDCAGGAASPQLLPLGSLQQTHAQMAVSMQEWSQALRAWTRQVQCQAQELTDVVSSAERLARAFEALAAVEGAGQAEADEPTGGIPWESAVSPA